MIGSNLMIHRIPRYLQGFVTFKITGKGREEFLNSCVKNGIDLFNVRFSENFICASCLVKDYKKTKKIRIKGLRKKIIKRNGIRFFTNRYKKRLGLAIGSALMVALLIILSGFVWDIDVTGNERLSENVILQTLEECGFSKGSHKSKLDISEIENKMMMKLVDLSRISINLDGSFAHIEVKERQMPPVMDDVTKPSNLVAAMDGIITKMEIVKGKPIAQVGSGVAKGQLLVAGFYNDKKDNIILEHSSGKVTAKVEISKVFELSLEGKEVVGQEEKIFYSIEFFNMLIDLSFGKEPSDSAFIKSENKTQLSIFGLKFPIYSIQKKYTKEVSQEKTLTQDEAKQKVKLEIDHYEKSELNNAQIMKKNITWKSDDKKCRAQVDYVVIMDIAKQQYIDTEQK